MSFNRNPLTTFASDRRFVVFSYSASHGLLLLRSGQTQSHKTRVDVLFQDVRAMEVRAWFDGIAIEEVSIAYLQGQRSKPDELIEPGNRVYSIKGQDWQGFVVGGILSTWEDEASYNAPSKLIAG